jgi:tetratricopeptide (TPR) repeat protein
MGCCSSVEIVLPAQAGAGSGGGSDVPLCVNGARVGGASLIHQHRRHADPQEDAFGHVSYPDGDRGDRMGYAGGRRVRRLRHRSQRQLPVERRRDNKHIEGHGRGRHGNKRRDRKYARERGRDEGEDQEYDSDSEDSCFNGIGRGARATSSPGSGNSDVDVGHRVHNRSRGRFNRSRRGGDGMRRHGRRRRHAPGAGENAIVSPSNSYSHSSAGGSGSQHGSNPQYGSGYGTGSVHSNQGNSGDQGSNNNNENASGNDHASNPAASLSGSGSGGDAASVAFSLQESNVTADDSAVVIAEDVAALLIGKPSKLLLDGLRRGRDLDQLNNQTIQQTVMILEEGIKKAEEQKSRVGQRGGRAGAHSSGNAGPSSAAPADPTDAAGEGNNTVGGNTNLNNGNNNNNAEASPAASNIGNNTDSENDGHGNVDDPYDMDDYDDDAELTSILLARANDLLARLYGLRRFERCSTHRSLAAFLRALEYLSTREDDVMLWSSIHMGLVRTLLARDHSAMGAVSIDGTPAEREAAIEELDGGMSHVNESRSITRAMRHAHLALEIYDASTTPKLYGEAWCALGEAHTRRADLPPTEDALADLSADPAGTSRSSHDALFVDGSLGYVAGNLLEARRCYEKALTAVTRDDDPEEWARIHSWLGHLALRFRTHYVEDQLRIVDGDGLQIAESELPRNAEDDALEGSTAIAAIPSLVKDKSHSSVVPFGATEAIEHLTRASEVFDRERKPVHYGNLQHAIGVAYLALADDRMHAERKVANTGGAGPNEVIEGGNTVPETFMAVQRALRRDLHYAVKAFSRALSVKTWSVNAGFDYSSTARCRADARRRLQVHLAQYANLNADIDHMDAPRDDVGPASSSEQVRSLDPRDFHRVGVD